MTSHEENIIMGRIVDRRGALLPTPGMEHLRKERSQKVVRHHRATKTINLITKGLSCPIKKRLNIEQLVDVSLVVKRAT
jgi:hypothetical protein